MRDSKLLKIIASLTAAERAGLSDFVVSPFVNKYAPLSDLCAYYLLFAPDFAHPDFSANEAFAAAYPQKKYDHEALIKINSRLLRLLEQYIVYLQSNADEWQQKFALLQFYNARNLTNLFESTLRVMQQPISPLYNQKYYFKKYLLDLELSNYESYKTEKGTGDVHFQATHNSLDLFYLCAKLEQLCLMRNRARITRYAYDYALHDELLAYLPTSIYYQNPTVQLWYKGLLLLNTPTLEHYNALQNALAEHSVLLTDSEVRNLYTYLENTSRQVFATDRIGYLTALFALYQTQLHKGVIYSEGNLPPQLFYNIFAVAMALQKMDWTGDFLAKNRFRIMPEYSDKDDVYTLCQAAWQFEHGNYDETLTLINQLEVDNIYFKITEKRLRLKTYFELREWDLFESLVNSFRKFLTDGKNKLPDAQLQPQRDFIAAAYTIYRSRKPAKQPATLKQDIDNQLFMPDRDWLLRHLDAL